MIEQRQIYHCAICGNVVEVLYAKAEALVCCGQPMNLLVENSFDAAREKHVPVIEDLGDSIRVKVGSIPHPMEEKHYIVLIEVLTGKQAYRHELSPGDAPEAVFPVKAKDLLYAREYCNLHGLWKN